LTKFKPRPPRPSVQALPTEKDIDRFQLPRCSQVFFPGAEIPHEASEMAFTALKVLVLKFSSGAPKSLVEAAGNTSASA
jgi:hypothetical protein